MDVTERRYQIVRRDGHLCERGLRAVGPTDSGLAGPRHCYLGLTRDRFVCPAGGGRMAPSPTLIGALSHDGGNVRCKYGVPTSRN
jgi:hypothetical protein